MRHITRGDRGERAANRVDQRPDDAAVAAALAKALVSYRLYQVAFVLDYVQFGFDGSGPNVTISAIVPATVELGERRYVWGDAGYRDALCARIARTVTAVRLEAQVELRLAFDDGAAFAVSLRPEDYQWGPEAVLIQEGTHWWVF